MKILLFLLPILLYAQVIDTIICLPDIPLNIIYIPNGNELYINCYRENRFFVLDCSTYHIKKVIPNGGGGSYYPHDAYGTWNWRRDKIYFTFNPTPDSIAVIDNQTDSIIKWINFGSVFQPNSLCYNSRDDIVYVAGGMSVAVINCENDSIIKIIQPQPNYLSHFAIWDSIGNKVYCGSSGDDKVTVIDCSSDSVIKVISTGLSSPWSAIYNSQRRKLYTGGEWGIGCAVIDAIRDTLVKYHNITYNFEILPIFNSSEDKVYWPGDSLYVIDCQNDSIIKYFGYIISNLGFSSWSNHLYITRDTWVGHHQGFLTVLDCHNDSLIANLEIGPGAIWITNNTQYQRTYIATEYDSSIYVIRDDVPKIDECTVLEAERTILEFYPNPVKNVICIRGLLSEKFIKIFDVSGKLIKVVNKVTSANKQEVRISLKSINPGIYFIEIGEKLKKFIVTK
jgi:YVTN family beta-propeller protein